MVRLVFDGTNGEQLTLVVSSAPDGVSIDPDGPATSVWQVKGLTRASVEPGEFMWPVLREWQELSLIYRGREGGEVPQMVLNGMPFEMEQLDPVTYLLRWRLKGQVGDVCWELRGKNDRLIWRVETEVFPLRLAYRQEFRQMFRDLQQVWWGLSFARKGGGVSFGRGFSREKGLSPTALVQELGRWWMELHRLTHAPPMRRLSGVNQPEHRYPKPMPPRRMAPMGVDHEVLKLIQQPLLDLLACWQPPDHGRAAPFTESYPAQEHRFSRGWYERLRHTMAMPPWSQLDVTRAAPVAAHARLTPRLRNFILRTERLQTVWDVQSGGQLSFKLKDTPTLYEYWVLMYLIRFLGEDTDFELRENHLKLQSEGDHIWRINRGGWISFARKSTSETLRVYYNPLIQPGQPGMPAQRPDLMIERKANSETPLRFVLEVKYQAHQGQHGWGAHPDGLAQVHRYRDALITDLREEATHRSAVKLLGGAVIFPHPRAGADFADHPQHKGLQRVGVGALPLTPGTYESNSLFKEWLSAWLAQSPDQLMEQRIEYRLK